MSEASQSPSASAPVSPEERLRIMEDLFGKEWVNDFDDPILFRSYTFTSKTATRFYLRNFAAMSHFLFAEILYRRRPDFDEKMLNNFVVTIAKKLADVQGQLVAHSQKVRKLCESNGQLADATYVHAHQLLVPIIAAHATSYMRCLVRLDELFQLTGSATLCGVIDGGQRKTIELTARRAMRHLHGVIRIEYTKLRKESERLQAPVPSEMADDDSERINGDQPQAADHVAVQLDDDDSCKLASPSQPVEPGASASYLPNTLLEADAIAEAMSGREAFCIPRIAH
jgi:hypothetical protein